MSAVVQQFEHSLALPFFGIGMKTDLYQSCGHCWVFQICWHIECSTFTTSSFRIWNSSTGIPSPPLALFVVMLRPTWLHIPRYLALGEWSHHRDYLGGEILLIYYCLPPCTLFSFDHHLFLLCIYDSISVLLCLFIFLRFHVKVKLCNIFLSLIISLSIIPSRFIHADANGKILSFYGWVLFHFICIPHYLSIHLLMDT